MQDAPKAVWSIPHVSLAFFPSLNQNFIAYRSFYCISSRLDCMFGIHQLWQSGFSRVNSNSCCCCSFEPEIIKIGQTSHKMYSNNILNVQESTTILNACTKKSGNSFKHKVRAAYYKFHCRDSTKKAKKKQNKQQTMLLHTHAQLRRICIKNLAIFYIYKYPHCPAYCYESLNWINHNI